MAISYADAGASDGIADRHGRQNSAIDSAIEMKAVGVTPEYIAAMRAAVPRLANLDFCRIQRNARGRSHARTIARAMVAAGFPNITADELIEARAVGLTGSYVSAMRSAGVRGDMDDFIQLRTVGVDPAFAARVRASGIRTLSADDLVELRALGISSIPAAPRSPAPPRPPQPDGDPDG